MLSGGKLDWPAAYINEGDFIIALYALVSESEIKLVRMSSSPLIISHFAHMGN